MCANVDVSADWIVSISLFLPSLCRRQREGRQAKRCRGELTAPCIDVNIASIIYSPEHPFARSPSFRKVGVAQLNRIKFKKTCPDFWIIVVRL